MSGLLAHDDCLYPFVIAFEHLRWSRAVVIGADDLADYSPVGAGLTSRLAVGPILDRDGSRRSTLSQTNGTILIHNCERDEELLGQQAGQFPGRF